MLGQPYSRNSSGSKEPFRGGGGGGAKTAPLRFRTGDWSRGRIPLLSGAHTPSWRQKNTGGTSSSRSHKLPPLPVRKAVRWRGSHAAPRGQKTCRTELPRPRALVCRSANPSTQSRRCSAVSNETRSPLALTKFGATFECRAPRRGDPLTTSP